MKEQEKKSKWASVVCDYICEEDGYWRVDAWKTDDENEEGAVIAFIDDFTGCVIYMDNDAEADCYAQEVISEKVRELKENNYLPAVIELDEGLTVTAANFREYAKLMQYPDPIWIEMSDELNEAATKIIQDKFITAWGMLNILTPKRKVKNGEHSAEYIDYAFDENGREGLVFPSLADATKIYTAYMSERDREGDSETQVRPCRKVPAGSESYGGGAFSLQNLEFGYEIRREASGDKEALYRLNKREAQIAEHIDNLKSRLADIHKQAAEAQEKAKDQWRKWIVEPISLALSSATNRKDISVTRNVWAEGCYEIRLSGNKCDDDLVIDIMRRSGVHPVYPYTERNVLYWNAEQGVWEELPDCAEDIVPLLRKEPRKQSH